MTDTQQKETGDRAWLYEEVLKFLSTPNRLEIMVGREPRPRSERQIYEEFAPMHGSSLFERPSWREKRRVTKRAMLRSVIRRLVVDGRIRLASEELLNLKTMNGTDRKDMDHLRRLFGSEFDGRVRRYVAINVLEGIVDALEGRNG
ncbi:MAG: hypothetical protein AB7L09_01485 [Nitrospira sp.]